MLPTLSMRLMVGITFVIAVLALGLHLRTFVSVPMFSEAPPRHGARLQPECESVIDTAGGAGVSQAEVFMTLENDPTIVEELKAKKLRFLPDQVDYVTADMPDPLQPAEIASLLAMRRSLLT